MSQDRFMGKHLYGIRTECVKVGSSRAPLKCRLSSNMKWQGIFSLPGKLAPSSQKRGECVPAKDKQCIV